MGLWAWFKGLFSKSSKQDKPIISLVMFERESRYVDTHLLTSIAERVTGAEFCDSDDSSNFVVGEPPLFVMQCQGMQFLIHAWDRPYVEDPGAAAQECKELRMQNAIREHRAWFAIDFLDVGDDPDVAAGEQIIGKFIAELANEDTLAIFCPLNEKFCVYDSILDGKLRGPNPLADFADEAPFVPVTQIQSDDPRMQAAVTEARRRWPEFAAAFESRKPDQLFAVKSPFSDQDHTEFMWLRVTGIENDVIYGILDNDPVDVSTVKSGDRVRVNVADLNDWMIGDDQSLRGGFTVKVLRDAGK